MGKDKAKPSKKGKDKAKATRKQSEATTAVEAGTQQQTVAGIQNPYQVASVTFDDNASKGEASKKTQKGVETTAAPANRAVGYGQSAVEWLWDMDVTLEADLHPARGRNPRLGVQEYLNGLLCRPLPHFDGVVLAWRDAQIVGTKGVVLTNVPYFRTSIRVSLVLFAPRVGLHLGTCSGGVVVRLSGAQHK